ncbi:hypothetical protein N0V83_001151 [Neocucurbitaria cava]|uniref:Uncharacterized protein n=1 Tax=Neocucurbitaria cava TaxID=798079 RepID=A0A9W8YHT9_9PLEO|nr:hypothetical protein N0V83_001151 [Neocucurbitaria cava]
MLFTTIVLSALATSTLAFPFKEFEKRNGGHKSNDPQASLPECNADPVACRCPADSFYQTSSSYSFWPVHASEITRLTVNFLDAAWLGTTPERTEGNGTAVGAKRYLRTELPDSQKAELVMEELTELTLRPDGGYYSKFRMGDAPFWYEKKTPGKKGLIAGSWDNIDVRDINGMAYMLWDIHVCFMDLFDLSGFHESAMNNLTSILKAEGKIPQGAATIGPITF